MQAPVPRESCELDEALQAFNNGNVRRGTLKGASATRKQIEETFTRLAAQVKEDDFFAVTLIGHGTFDGAEYKFNVPGPDPTATDLARWMDRIPARQQLIAVLATQTAWRSRVPAEEEAGSWCGHQALKALLALHALLGGCAP